MMGLFNRRRGDAAGKAITAASLPLEGPNKVRVGRHFKAGQDDWQNESWYMYDAVGEYRSALTWVANAVSKADVHAAEIDEETGTAGEPTDNSRVQQIAAAVLGGFEQRPGHLKTLAQQWQAAGESFVIVMPQTRGPDRWLVLSGRRVQYKGAAWQFTDPLTLMPVTLTSRELLMRVWSPHPDDPVKADSAARTALPILREIEKASQHIVATLDSRLGTAGVHAIPMEVNFPRGESSLSDALTDYYVDAVTTNIRNPGDAAARAPIFLEMPGEQIPNFAAGFIDYATQFQSDVPELRQTALGRLAATLDMPNETAAGSVSGMNHWGAWQVEESTYKIYIEPLLEALGNALTLQWFRPALAAAGIANPERYTLAWDTTSIISRPDRTSELLELHERVLISDDYLRSQQGIPDDAIPDDEERRRRTLESLVRVAPTLLADPAVAQALDLGIEISPAAANVDPAAVEGAPQPVDNSRALPADTAEERPDGMLAAAEFAVYDALARAGKRLLTREHRGQFAHVSAERLYLEIPHDRDPADLLEGSFAFIDTTRYPVLARTVRAYTELLVRDKREYRRDELRNLL